MVKSSPATTQGRPPIRAAPTTKLVGRKDCEATALVELGFAGGLTDFVPALRVDELFHALAHREPAARVLALDGLLAAELLRETAARLDLVGFVLPAHGGGR